MSCKYNFQLIILIIFIENHDEHRLFAHFAKVSTFIYGFPEDKNIYVLF